MLKRFKTFISDIEAWGSRQEDIFHIVLVGSYARGTAREDSDIDVVIIAERPESYIEDRDFIHLFGAVKSVAEEDWGMVTSLRVFYEDGLEVEYGITSPKWISAPLDPGTKKVLSDGYKVIYDRTGSFEKMAKM